jgi:hypothetical protein
MEAAGEDTAGRGDHRHHQQQQQEEEDDEEEEEAIDIEILEY